MENTILTTNLKGIRENYAFLSLDAIAELYCLETTKTISKQAINYWLNGKRIPSIENIKIIADIFCVSLDYLMGRKKEMYDEEIISNLEKEIPFEHLIHLPFRIPKEYKNETIRKQNYYLETRVYMLMAIRLSEFDLDLSKKYANTFFYDEWLNDKELCYGI